MICLKKFFFPMSFLAQQFWIRKNKKSRITQKKNMDVFYDLSLTPYPRTPLLRSPKQSYSKQNPKERKSPDRYPKQKVSQNSQNLVRREMMRWGLGRGRAIKTRFKIRVDTLFLMFLFPCVSKNLITIPQLEVNINTQNLCQIYRWPQCVR